MFFPDGQEFLSFQNFFGILNSSPLLDPITFKNLNLFWPLDPKLTTIKLLFALFSLGQGNFLKSTLLKKLNAGVFKKLEKISEKIYNGIIKNIEETNMLQKKKKIMIINTLI